MGEGELQRIPEIDEVPEEKVLNLEEELQENDNETDNNQPNLEVLDGAKEMTDDLESIKLEPGDPNLEEKAAKIIENRLEQLMDPEFFEGEIEKQIAEAEERIAFDNARNEAMLNVAMGAGVAVGGIEINDEIAAGAREIMGRAVEAVEKLGQIDIKSLAKAASEKAKEQREKIDGLSLAPLAIPAIAAALKVGSEYVPGLSGVEVDMSAAMMASVKLTASMIAIDIALAGIEKNAAEVLPAQYLLPILAGSTNLTELVSAQGSAFAGDPTADVASTPLGSNPTNIFLTGAAMMTALKERVKIEREPGGMIEDEDVNKKADLKEQLKIIKTITKDKEFRKQFGMAGVFMIDALAFQFVVRPQMKKGNFLPLGAWAVINAPLMVEYFRKTTFGKKAKLHNSINEVGDVHVDKLREDIVALSDDNDSENPEEGNPMMQILKSVEMFKEDETSKEEKDEASENIKDQIKLLQQQFIDDPQFQDSVEEILSKASMKNIKTMLEMGGSKFKKDKVDKKKVAKLLASVAAVGITGGVIDSGLNDLVKGFSFLGKSTAGFVVMSFLSSIGEFKVSKNYFKRAQDKKAMENITASNAINIGIAQSSMATSAASQMFRI